MEQPSSSHPAADDRTGCAVPLSEPSATHDHARPVQPTWDFVLPLVYQENSDDYTHIVRDSLGRMVTHMAQDTSGRTEQMARRIVQCVNAHDDLVAALRLLIEADEAQALDDGMFDSARAALAKSGISQQ